MIHPLRMHYDKLLLVLAIAALGGSLDWVRRHQPGLRLLRTEAMNPNRPAAAYVSAARKEPATSVPVWPRPRVQAQGEGWRYEVFTPPAIHYDPGTRAFALIPTESAAEEPGVQSSTKELRELQAEAFRLQLIGYFGPPDDYLVAFRSALSAETLLARPGHHFAELELTFRSFEVRQVLVTETESGPVHEVAAFATVLDERSHREVVLDSRTQRFTDTPVAQTASGPAPLPQVGAERVAANSQ